MFSMVIIGRVETYVPCSIDNARYARHRRRALVIEMNPSFHTLGSEYDDFLFASIGEDKNGLLLSVVSALARRNIDPWQEAAELARLPEEAATSRLTVLIAALPDIPATRLASRAIAARLIALLPRRRPLGSPAAKASIGTSTTARSDAISYMIVYAILLALVLGVQYFTSGNRPAAPTDSTTSQQNSRTNSD
jgi:hypothetical protein